MYFLTYEVISEMLKPNNEQQSFGQKLLVTIPAGGMAGIANWIVGMPPDVLKSRLQTGNNLFDLFCFYFFISITNLQNSRNNYLLIFEHSSRGDISQWFTGCF